MLTVLRYKYGVVLTVVLMQIEVAGLISTTRIWKLSIIHEEQSVMEDSLKELLKFITCSNRFMREMMTTI